MHSCTTLESLTACVILKIKGKQDRVRTPLPKAHIKF